MKKITDIEEAAKQIGRALETCVMIEHDNAVFQSTIGGLEEPRKSEVTAFTTELIRRTREIRDLVVTVDATSDDAILNAANTSWSKAEDLYKFVEENEEVLRGL